MTFTGTLLPYQPEAVDFMVERGAVLVSYDLGLGKTVMTIAAIEHLMDTEQIVKPGLVICLSSLKFQWAEAITQFTQGTSIPLVVDGTRDQRQAQYERAFQWESDYTIMSYEQVVNDWDAVRQLPRGFVICDEATAIKSFRAQRSRQVKKLKSPYRFALTGTPIENGKPEELYSIMEFVDSTVLGRFDLFDKAFIKRDNWGGVQSYRNLPTLHKKLMTACVRKGQDDDDVSPFLPEVITRPPLRIPFDRAGAKLYKRITKDLLHDLEDAEETYTNFSLEANYGHADAWAGDEANALRGAIMSKLTCLRMLCDHPELLRISAERYNASGPSSFGVQAGSAYAAQLKDEGAFRNLSKAPKYKATNDYLSQFLELDSGNKVVLFSYFKPTLAMFHDLWALGMSTTYTGDLSSKEKEANKKRFQTDPECRILLSSDAGGYGVDLPQANMLINYDLPWAAGTAKQRNGRIRRASSTFSHVVIQDMLMAGSIEERQWEALQQKDSVATAIMDDRGSDNEGSLTLTLGSLSKFLREEGV